MSGVVPVDDWAVAKDEYFALTHAKKPREKVAKFFTTTHTGLSKTIQNIADFDKLKPNDKTAEKYGKLVAEYKKSAATYIKLLTDLIESEDEKTMLEYTFAKGKVDVKTVKTDMYRGLKMLKAKLENYSALYDVQHSVRQHMELGTEKIDRMEQQFPILMKNGLKRFMAAAQAVKTTPTVAVWNREMGNGDGVRSLTTALGAYRAIEKELTKGNIDLSHDQTQKLNLTNHWIAQLSPWADGNRKTLPDGTDVIAELKMVSGLVKMCQAAVGV